MEKKRMIRSIDSCAVNFRGCHGNIKNSGYCRLSSVQLKQTEFEMDSPPSCSLSAGPLSDLGSSGLGGSISSDSVRAHLAMEVGYFL